MSVSFDANVLVYATATFAGSKSVRARALIARAMRAQSSILLLQSLAEFSNVAIRKVGLKVEAVREIVAAWEALLPVEAAHRDDLAAALGAVKAHRLAFWDAMLWATASRIGVRQVLSEDFQDGFRLGSVTFLDPFKSANDALIDAALPP